jgi:hypothetical protein
MAFRIKTLKMPLIMTGVFVLSCLMPVIQILIMTFDGGLLAIVNKLLFEDKPVKVDATNWIVNFSLSVLFLIFLYKTSSMVGKVTFSILGFIFLFCFFAFLIGDRYGETNPYFLYFMLISLVSGLILCATAIVKSKVQQA